LAIACIIGDSLGAVGIALGGVGRRKAIGAGTGPRAPWT